MFLNNKLGTIVELLSLLEEDHVVGVSERGQCRRVRDEEKKTRVCFLPIELFEAESAVVFLLDLLYRAFEKVPRVADELLVHIQLRNCVG